MQFEGVLVGAWRDTIKEIEKPKIEDAFREGKDWYAVAYRLKTGFEDDGRVTLWSEVIVARTDVLTPSKFAEICTDLYDRNFFRYRTYYDDIFSRTVFVIAKSVKGKIAPKKVGNTLFVPVRAESEDEATSVASMYLANFFWKRLFRVLNAIFDGAIGAARNIWRLFRLMRKGVVSSIRRIASSSIKYIIELISELESRASSDVVNTVKILFSMFEKLLKIIDRIEMPKVLRRRAEKVLKLVKKLGIPDVSIPRVLAAAINLHWEMEREFARGYIDLLSKAEHIKC